MRNILRWAFVGAVALAGVRLAMLAAADAIAFANPGLALMLDGANVRALTVRASSGSAAGDQAAEDARAALMADPFASGAYRVLARAAETDGEEARARALWLVAARTARDGEAQSAMILRALKDADAGAAIQRFDILLRGQQPRLWRSIVAAATPLFADPAIAEALAATLATDPPWRRAAVIELIERAPDARFVSMLYERLQMAGRPSDEEARAYIRRLVRDGRMLDGYAVFLGRLPEDRLGRLGYLYNARFQHGLANLPFEWELSDTPGALSELVREQGRAVLRVSFFGGRAPLEHVNRLLALPAGSFTFSGVERADSLENPRGLRWVVRCAGEGGAELGATGLLRGQTAWRPFALTFTVPAECPVQRLVLELAARVALEREASGSASFADMGVEKSTPGK